MRSTILATIILTLLSVRGYALSWNPTPPTNVGSGQSYTVAATHTSPPYSMAAYVTVYRNGSLLAYASQIGPLNPYNGYTASVSMQVTDTASQTIVYYAEGRSIMTSGGVVLSTMTATVKVGQLPTIQWLQASVSAAVNHPFSVQARGNDVNGNLTSVQVSCSNGQSYQSTSPGAAQLDSPATSFVQPTAAVLAFFAVATDSDGFWSPTITRTVTVSRANGAQFVSQNVPTNVTAGQTFAVTQIWKNSGTIDWGTNHKVGAQNPLDNTTWGSGRYACLSGIYAGTDTTVTFNLTAPSTPGTYNFQSRIVEEAIEWFGDTSPNVAVTVSAAATPVNGAQLLFQSVPNPVYAGQTFTVTQVWKNTGTKPWGANHKIGAQNPQDNVAWGSNRYACLSGVNAGAQTTVTYNVTAPSTAGTCNFQSQMREEGVGWFGDISPNVAVTVYAGSADTDNDHMADGWERFYWVNLTPTGLGDPDGDGLTNVAEYNLGTNPTINNPGTSTLGTALPAGWAALVGGNPSLSQAVGITAGQLSVDKSGAATYSIPLWVTPGTAGMQPQLSLNYSSQAGVGIAGFGWSLGGASAITRGPATRAIDGFVGGVKFDANDRFFLDGQRLIAINGGAYGANNTEYRTEIESFSRIISYGAKGNGPAWFKVWTKAGLIVEFGNTTDSAFDAWGRNEIMSWQVNKISDTSGNYITFSYHQDAANGVERLDRIDYTGNTAAGVLPYASVQFSYTLRADPFRGYVYGCPVSTLYRLDSIGVYFGSTLARTYTLGYTARPNTNRQLLTNLTETGTDGTSYPPLNFNYSNPSAGWTSLNGAQWAPPVPIAAGGSTPRGELLKARPRGTGFIDLNGDGRPDFVRYHNDSEHDAWLNTPNGWVLADGQSGNPDFRPPFVLVNDDGSDTGARWADVNGDGLPDAIGQNGQVYLNTGSGFILSTYWQLPSQSSPGNDFLDLNGDGLVDVILADGTCYLNAGLNAYGSGWIIAPQYKAPLDRTMGARFVDVNGDGLPDQVQNWYGQNTTYQGVALNNGNGWTVLASGSDDFNRFLPPQLLAVGTTSGGTNTPFGTELVDLNGDGLIDLIHCNDNPASNVAYFNTGHGWVQAPSSFNSPYVLTSGNDPRGRAFVDINNDGIVDVVDGWDINPSAWSVRLGTGASGWSTGAGPQLNLPRQLSQPGISNTGTDLVDLNGDGALDEVWNWQDDTGAWSGAVVNQRVNPDRLTTVTNGFGVKAQITYQPLTARDASGNPTVYIKASDLNGIAPSEQPKVMNVTGPMYVVSAVSNDDGVGGQYVLNYAYGGLRVHRDRGSLGFAWMSVVDSRTHIASTTAFAQDYPFIGMPVDSCTKTNDGTGTLLAETTTAYDQKLLNNGANRFLYATSVQSSTHDLNGDLVSQSIIMHGLGDFDSYGNCLNLVVDTGDGCTKTTVSTYDNVVSSNNWFLGRLRRSTVTAVAPGNTQTRVSSFTYDEVNTGLLLTETVEPDRSSDPAYYTLTTTYQYDGFGNKTSVSVAGGGFATRTTTTTYDPAGITGASGPNGRFPQKTTNALNQSETYTYDLAKGVALSLTGPNHLTTSWLYDGFGRKTQENRADGTQTITYYRWADYGSQPGSKYLVETDSSGAPPSVVFYDSFGRSIATYGLNGGGLDGNARIVGACSAYDAQGRAYATSLPYYYGLAPTGWTTVVSYDLLDRPTQVSTPNDDATGGLAYTGVSYQGLATETTNPKGQVERVEKNRQGQVVRRINNKGAGSGSVEYGKVEYAYDAYGNLTTTTVYKEDGTTPATNLYYDVRGRKWQMVDLDMGTWTYKYDADGELISQTDAKGQTSTLTYDLLGRMATRIEPGSPTPTPAITTTWTYDTATNGVGKLQGIACTGDRSKTYSESYTYDTLGRPTCVSRTIDGTAYSTSQSYDSSGRPEYLTYPSGFKVRNVYNAFGFLKEVREGGYPDPGSGRKAFPNEVVQGQLFWAADSYSVWGQVDGAILGNGLIYDRLQSPITGRIRTISAGFGIGPASGAECMCYAYDVLGNVTQRLDTSTGRDERFSNADGSDGYDGLNRLRVQRIIGGATVTVAYDALGNIANKSDVGAANYIYHRTGEPAMPHAVRCAGGISYYYDLNGNMTSGAGRNTMTWTSFNQLSKVTLTATGENSEFWFGAGHERVLQQNSNGTTTVYVGSLFEKVTSSGGLAEYKDYIMTPLGRTAVHTVRSDSTVETRYLHQDALGSIYAVTDEFGRVEKRFTYDAWGKRLNPVDTHTGTGGKMTRGYTDHEMLDDYGLIHMNGRVYDPVLARFLSADSYVQDAGDSQTYNRYSYCVNNPLNSTDPSGYRSLRNVLKVMTFVDPGCIGEPAFWLSPKTYNRTKGAIDGIAVTAYLEIVGWWTDCVPAMAGGFVSGFQGSILNGGSIGDSFRSGLIGAGIGLVTYGASSAIGSGFGPVDNPSLSTGDMIATEAGRAVAHGVVGGLIEEAQGGEFRNGFYSGFAGSAAGSISPYVALPPLADRDPSAIVERTAFAAAVGGTVSELGGGKFANGAITAAFQHLFNDEGFGHAGHNKITANSDDPKDNAKIDAMIRALRSGINTSCDDSFKVVHFMDAIEKEGDVPVYIKIAESGHIAETDPITMDGRIVGYQIILNPHYNDLVVSLAHEFYHAAAGSVGGYARYVDSGGGIYAHEAIKIQNEVAFYFHYKIEFYDEWNNEVEDPLAYAIRSR